MEATGRREPKIKTAASRCCAGQTHASGCDIKKAQRPVHGHRLVAHLQADFGVSEYWACRVLEVHRSLYRYKSLAELGSFENKAMTSIINVFTGRTLKMFWSHVE